MNQLSKVAREEKLILLVFSQRTFYCMADDTNAIHIEGVIQVADKRYMRIRPHVQEFLEKCRDYYEMILVSNYDSNITGEFVRQVPPIAESFNNRILTSKDYKSSSDIKAWIPNEVHDRVLYMSITQNFDRTVPWLPIAPYKFLNKSGKTVNGAVERFVSEKHVRLAIPDPDTRLLDAQNNLAEIYQKCFREADKFQADKLSKSVDTCRKMIEISNKPKNPEAPKHETVAQCQQLTRSRLKRDNKMILLVDLDNTILHSCADYLASRVVAADIHFMPSCDRYTRYRPGTRQLLEMMVEKYEMIVVTTGSANYAADCVAAIDPDKRFFKNRIFAKSDMQNKDMKHVKKTVVLEHFPRSVRDMIVIIDDKQEVWMNEPIVHVEAYTYWHESQCAFDEQTSLDVMINEFENKEEMRMTNAPKDDDDYLLRVICPTLLKLHAVCDPAGTCDTLKLQKELLKPHMISRMAALKKAEVKKVKNKVKKK